MSDKSDRHLYHKYETLNLAKMGSHGQPGGISGGGINHSPPLSRATSPLNHDYDNGKFFDILMEVDKNFSKKTH
jgi:hypothetical protein